MARLAVSVSDGQVSAMSVYDLFPRKSTKSAEQIIDKDAIIIVGRCRRQMGIDDFRLTIAIRRPRYDERIAPNGRVIKVTKPCGRHEPGSIQPRQFRTVGFLRSLFIWW